MQSATDPGALAIIFSVGAFIYFIPSLIIFARLFVRAGQPGWKLIIPIYSQYTMGVIAKNPVLGLVSGVSWIISDSWSYTHLLPSLAAGFGIVSLVSSLVVLILFMRQYTAGFGRWVLFLFVPIIGVFVMKSTKYKTATTTPPRATVQPAPVQ